MFTDHTGQHLARIALHHTDAVNPAPIKLDEIPNVGEPHVMGMRGAIGQVVVADGLRLLVLGALPRPWCPVELAVDGHRSSHCRLTGRRLVPLLVKQAMDAKATGSWIPALQV